MKINFFNTTLAAALLMGFVACKNNSTPAPAANTTTPSTTNTTSTTNTEPAKAEASPVKEAAQKMCACEGVRNYFAKLKTFDGKPEAELNKAMVEFAPLKKPLDECTKNIKAEMQTKYPDYKPAEGDYQKEMISACGDIMPQRLIDKYSK